MNDDINFISYRAPGRSDNEALLTSLTEGEDAVIAGCEDCDGDLRRLSHMGLCKGAKVRMLYSACGHLIVLVRGSIVALGHGAARKVIVRR